MSHTVKSYLYLLLCPDVIGQVVDRNEAKILMLTTKQKKNRFPYQRQ